jgi:hypothetical protein
MPRRHTIATVALTLLVAIVGVSADEFDGEERAVIEAALRSPNLVRRCHREFAVLPRSEYNQGGSLMSREEIERHQAGDLIGSILRRNQKSISLRRIAVPTCAREEPRDSLRLRLRVSRPGFSVDGSRAIVVLEDEDRLGGQTVLLEKTEGVWKATGLGTLWVV